MCFEGEGESGGWVLGEEPWGGVRERERDGDFPYLIFLGDEPEPLLSILLPHSHNGILWNNNITTILSTLSCLLNLR